MKSRLPAAVSALATAALAALLFTGQLAAQTAPAACPKGTTAAAKACAKAENERITALNTALSKALNDGNTAFNAKNYDEAIAAWTSGINLAPDHPGAATLNRNIGAALRQKSAETWNATVPMPEGPARDAARSTARATMRDSLTYSLLANSQAQKFRLPPEAKATALDVREIIRLMDRTGGFRELDRMKQVEPQAKLFEEWLAGPPAPPAAEVARYGPSAVRAQFERNKDLGLALADKMLAAAPRDPATLIAYGSLVASVQPADRTRRTKAIEALGAAENPDAAAQANITALLAQLKS